MVLVGKNTCSIFAENGAPFTCNAYQEFVGVPQEKNEDGHNNSSTNKYMPYCFTMDKITYGALFSPCEIVGDGKINATFAENPNQNGASLCVTTKYGKGKITAVGFDIGSQYLNGTQFMHRDLMKKISKDLYTPMVEIDSVLGRLEIVATKKNGKTLIQLVNAGGTHADSACATDDYIPPVLDIKLSINAPTPKS